MAQGQGAVRRLALVLALTLAACTGGGEWPSTPVTVTPPRGCPTAGPTTGPGECIPSEDQIPQAGDETEQALGIGPGAQPPVPAPGTCHSTRMGSIPDPKCTPGALNPAVTQASIGSTICVPGWTATVRPPVSWTGPLKRRLMKSYGLSSVPVGSLELDHRVPLGSGGSPTAVANLWPQNPASPNFKDSVEVKVQRDICSGKITLAHGQSVWLNGTWRTYR